MVTSPKRIALRLGAPLHLYYRSLLEFFDIAPMQLSPNSYRLAAALLILYTYLGFDPPTMIELSYFFNLGASNIGYYYLVVWKPLFGKVFSEGRISNTKGWKEPFLYLRCSLRLIGQMRPLMPSMSTKGRLWSLKTLLQVPLKNERRLSRVKACLPRAKR